MNKALSQNNKLSYHRAVFFQLLANTLIVSVVNFTVWFAITFFVYLETKSVFATSIIAGLYLVLAASSGIWFGSLVDHHKKKSAMLYSTIGSLIFYCIAALIYFLTESHSFKDPASPMLWLLVVSVMLGVIVGNIRTIALPTLVTILIPADRRDKANGLVGTTSGVSFLVTSVISGVLVGLSGMTAVLWLAIVSMIIAIGHIILVKVPEKGVVHTAESGAKKVDIRGTLKIVMGVPGLVALILFSTFNNFLGGTFMALMDAYGLTLVSVEVWGFLWGFLSAGFIIGGALIAKWGLGHNPLRTMLLINVGLWIISSVFTVQASIILLAVGLFIYMCFVPFVEAAEQTILQKVVPLERQGRVFGFAQSVEQAASPLTAFLIGPLTQFIFIPFMTNGVGAQTIGSWYGTGPGRGMALVFTVAGVIGLVATLIALRSKYYRLLSLQYQNGPVAASAVPSQEELSRLA